MKALIVEDEAPWGKQIKAALHAAVPGLSEALVCSDPSSAEDFLKGSSGWEYQLIVLDWGFLGEGKVTTSADLADFIHKERGDAFVIILTGGTKDKRMASDEVMELLIKAKAAEKIFKYEVSKKLDAPETGLPKLVAKLKELKLDEKVRQRAMFGFQFQPDFLSGTVHGERFDFPVRTALIVKLLYEKRLHPSPGVVVPGVVTKEEIAKMLADNGHKSTVERTDWKVTEEFKKGDSKKFKEKFLELEAGGSKGHYRLRLPQGQQ